MNSSKTAKEIIRFGKQTQDDFTVNTDETLNNPFNIKSYLLKFGLML